MENYVFIISFAIIAMFFVIFAIFYYIDTHKYIVPRESPEWSLIYDDFEDERTPTYPYESSPAAIFKAAKNKTPFYVYITSNGNIPKYRANRHNMFTTKDSLTELSTSLGANDIAFSILKDLNGELAICCVDKETSIKIEDIMIDICHNEEEKENKKLAELQKKQALEKAAANKKATDRLENELSQIIGLESVKDYVRGLSNNLRIQAERREKGLKTGKSQTMHMIFTGNPGTGKTTMARVIANVLHGCGVIPTNKLIETDRSGLVGQYIGETAQKTKEVVTSALGGILFIDEAYSLAQGGDKDFGKEAIDTLVKMMEDNRDNLVVILAGYTEDMEDFLDKNAGLKSRFPNIIEFPDYTNDELLQITKKLCFEQDYILDEGAEDALIDAFNDARTGKNFGNGREARNILEKAIRNQGTRLSRSSGHTRLELQTLLAIDVA